MREAPSLVSVISTLCSCGSGRSFDRCHGDPRNEFARTQALGEARQVALLFPSVRFRAQEALALAERLARELGDDEELRAEALADAAAAIEEREARRLVDEWSAAYPDRWASLCHAAADVEAAEAELVQGALAAVIHERLPTPPELVVELELVELSPLPSLAFLLPPQFVWAYDEARTAAVALPDQIDEVAAALGRIEHVERVRTLAGFVRRELPFRSFPRTTAALTEACAAVEKDIDSTRAVMTLCLIAYVHEIGQSYITSPN